MQIQLSEHFSYKKLIRFVFPSIVMMIFTSIYSIVDGLFVSNFVGKTSFAAINLIMPLLIILGAFGFMMGTGGSAIVAKTMGEGDYPKANRYFSMLVYATAIGGVFFALCGEAVLPIVAGWLGARDQLLEDCILYGRILLAGIPFFMLQNIFQCLFISAERPKLGLWITVISGVSNMVLDALFVAGFSWGLAGAAVATVFSQFLGAVIPLLYFAFPNTSPLRLGKTRFYGSVMLKTLTNGSSELMGNIAASVVTILFNAQLMKFAGEDGLSAYGAIMYVSFLFASVSIGYAVGSAPLVSYHYGAKNTDELKNLFRKSAVIIGMTSVTMTCLSLALAKPISNLFVGYDEGLYQMTLRGFYLFSFVYLMSGFCIYASSFFTALNNGFVSALISFLRTLVFQSIFILLLPLIWGLDGVWVSTIFSEFCSFALSLSLLIGLRKKYGYL